MSSGKNKSRESDVSHLKSKDTHLEKVFSQQMEISLSYGSTSAKYEERMQYLQDAIEKGEYRIDSKEIAERILLYHLGITTSMV